MLHVLSVVSITGVCEHVLGMLPIELPMHSSGCSSSEALPVGIRAGDSPSSFSLQWKPGWHSFKQQFEQHCYALRLLMWLQLL